MYQPSLENERRRRLTILEDGAQLEHIDGLAGDDDQGDAVPGLRRRLSWVGGNEPGTIPDSDGMEGDTFHTTTVRLSIGAVSRPGNDPMKRRKENQDCYCLHDVFNNVDDQVFMCVLDGHGPNGAYASHFVRDRLPKEYAAVGEHLFSHPENSLTQATLKTAAELTRSGIDVNVSGTTAVTAILKGDKLIVANVGDSRAVLGTRDTATGKVTAFDMSYDHKPDQPGERARIEVCGGRVFSWGVPRVWLKDVDMPGLAMSRSFGDLVAESVGVIANPEVKTRTIEDGDSFLVLATDGVWEFMSSQQAIDLVATFLGSDPQEACKALVNEAVKRWQAEEEVIDDTTAIVVFFNRSNCQKA